MPTYYDRKDVPHWLRRKEEGTINFKGVDFHYPSKPDVQVLKDCNIEVANNQVVALVGHSGSGKSSIIALIERFYDPDSGQVLFNGENIKDLDSCWYHQEKLAIVQQEPALFSTTVEANILYGFDRPDLTEDQKYEKMKEAIKLAQCQFIFDRNLFPDGL